MDGIYDDNNSIDVVQIDGLINTASDGKELSFSSHKIDSIIDYFDNQTVIDVNMCY